MTGILNPNANGFTFQTSATGMYGQPANFQRYVDLAGYRQQNQTKAEQDEAARQRAFTAQQNEANRQQQMAIANLPYQQKQQTLNQVLPMFSQFFGQGSNNMGQVSQQPTFNPSPLYTDRQINEQVNAGVAQNDARYGGLSRQLEAGLTGTGFGAASPAMEQMRQNLGMSRAASNSNIERQIPFETAQANADSLFRGQQLQQNMWKDRESSDIARRRSSLDTLNAIISLLG